MAKIVFGGLISDARNKEGGLVYSRNRSGSYSKAWFKPPNPQTPRQQANRAFWKTALDRWSGTLNEAQRLAWNSFADAHPMSHARIGPGRRSGQHWFLCLNFSTWSWTRTYINDPPPNLKGFECGAILQFAIDTTAHTITIETKNTPTVNDITEIWMTRAIPMGVMRIYSGLVANDATQTNLPSPTVEWNDYVTQFPVPVAGKKYGLMVRGHRISNGVKGQRFYATCVAT